MTQQRGRKKRIEVPIEPLVEEVTEEPTDEELDEIKLEEESLVQEIVEEEVVEVSVEAEVVSASVSNLNLYDWFEFNNKLCQLVNISTTPQRVLYLAKCSKWNEYKSAYIPCEAEYLKPDTMVKPRPEIGKS